MMPMAAAYIGDFDGDGVVGILDAIGIVSSGFAARMIHHSPQQDRLRPGCR